jgi:hypothetical protein
MEKQKLPNATAVLILGILSILTCCCYGILGIIMAVIALVLAKKDTQLYMANPELYSNYTNIKTGKVLAYIGLVLSILYLLLVIWMLLTFGFEGMQDQQLMEEKMRELLGQ